MAVRFLSTLLLLLAIRTPSLTAQTKFQSISGTVVDNTGAPVSDAHVSVVNDKGQIVAEVISGKNGKYETPKLPSGQYIVKVSFHGMKPFESTVLIGSSLYSGKQVLKPPSEGTLATPAPPGPLPQPSVTLNASPTSVRAGEKVVLFWSSLDATDVDIEPGYGKASIKGSGELFPTQSTTFTITATGAGGTATATTRVTVLPSQEVTAPQGREEVVQPNEKASTLTPNHDQEVILNLRDLSSLTPNDGVLIDGQHLEGLSLVQTTDGVILRSDHDASKQIPVGAHSVQASLGNAADKAVTKIFIWKDETQKLLGMKPFGNNYAVVIAVSKYDVHRGFAQLPSAVPQAKELAEVLRKQGFVVKEFYDPDATKDNLEHYLYSELNPRLKEDDRVLIYFGGHGFTQPDAQGKKAGFLVTWDANKANIAEKGIMMSKVEQEYETQIRARHVLFVLDACFAGLATRDGTPTLTDLDRYQTLLEINELSGAPSRSVLTAGGDEDPAVDNSGGIFTTAFIDGIKGGADANHNGVVTELELVSYVKAIVRAQARVHFYHQEPQYDSPPLFGHGEFIFLYK